MRWEVNGARLQGNCEADALCVFEKTHLFTKEELITSLECHIDYFAEEKGLTEKSREKHVTLYKQFLSAIKKCKLPELAPSSWRYYQYEFVGDGIILELCTAKEIEFHDEELDSMSLSDSKELLRVDSEYVGIKEFAGIQGVKEATVVRWLNAGKLKSAKLDGDIWSIPAVQDKPRKERLFEQYLLETGLRIDEYPFVQYSDNIWIQQDDSDKSVYTCEFDNYTESFHEEIVLNKKEVERLEYLLIASGKAKLASYMQWMPCIK
jgi:hypothetical protein